jgi:hypothetical protein
MGRILFDEIAGLIVNGQIVCAKCATKDEFANVKEDEVMTWKSIEEAEEMVFCDRCMRGLNSQAEMQND